MTLSVEQIEELNKKLSTMRHDVNNHLSLMLAAMELIRFKPDTAAKMLDNMIQQPPKVTAVVNSFSEVFEKAFGITKP